MGGLIKLFKSNKPDVKNDNKNIEELSENYKIIKIHICGYGKNKTNVIKSLFSKKITNPNLEKKGDSEYKSNNFYWITKNYEDKILTKEIVKSIQDNIEEDRPKINNEEEEEEEEEEEDLKNGKNKKEKKEEKENINNEEIYFHILLLFGDDNDIDIVLEEIDEVYRPRIIFVTEKKMKEEFNTDSKKYITNIICEGMDETELNSNIISSLWELDCYYNEKGNEIFRQTPINILKGFQTDKSFFSINILLTGLSRSGKSSFINLLSEKLVALESNDSDSVTLKVSEYYIYRNDDKREHGAIKLIDTPGMCEKKKVNSKTIDVIKDYLDNKDNKIEKHIHFILFFFMEGASPGNSEKLLKILNKYDYPVFFIINKSVDRRDKGISSDISSKIKFLKKRQFNNLAKKENFIMVNIKSPNIFGVDEIFKKIEKYIIEKKLLDNNILEKMEKIQKKYRMYSFENKNYDINIDINELNKNLIFKNLTLNSIKEHGQRICKKYKRNIILLSDLKNVFPKTWNNIPIISFLQAFMVKEIGAGYGFDFENVSFCFKQFDNKIKDFNINDFKGEEEQKSKIEIFKVGQIERQKSELNEKIKNIWEASNSEVIERIVNRINDLTYKEGKEKDIKNDIENTKAISKICQYYFEKELDKSHGLTFFIYYFKKNLLLMEDIKYYIEKKDWGKDEVQIIQKKK